MLNGIQNFLQFINNNWTTIVVIISLIIAIGKKAYDYFTKSDEEKIEVAKKLLQYSDYSMIDIANRLSFSSQSHFIQQFREIVGMTPKKYKDLYYMKQWDVEEAGDITKQIN